MESLISKLNHATNIITLARYLLNQPRHLQKNGNKRGQQCLQPWNRQCLHLWINIFQWTTYEGLTINTILLMAPTGTLWYDACKYMIIGYNGKCMTWCYYICPKWHGLLTLNLPEFLASAIPIYM